MDSVWKAIPGTGGWYEASDAGQIRSTDRTVYRQMPDGRVLPRRVRGRVLLCSKNPAGYYTAELRLPNGPWFTCVHRLVALAFLGEATSDADVNHIDGDKGNNAPANLEWCTHKENMAHARRAGLHVLDRPVVGIPLGGGPEVRFASALKASRALNMARSAVSKAAAGTRPTAGGYRWRYENADFHPLPVNYVSKGVRSPTFRPLNAA